MSIEVEVKEKKNNIFANYRQAANPLYGSVTLISLNHISVVVKNTNYIRFWANGNEFIAIGKLARSILLSMGDHSNQSYYLIPVQEEAALVKTLSQAFPQAIILPQN